MTALVTAKSAAFRRHALEAHRRAARASLAYCVRWLWPVLNPGRDFVHGYHIDAMAEVCQAQAEGKIDQFLVNVPPGTSKSTTISRVYPVWLWLHEQWAHRGLLFMSHSEAVAHDLQRDRLTLMQSPRYQLLKPRGPDGSTWDFTVAGVTSIKTDARGFMSPYTYRQGPTGSHPDTHLYDDPHKSGASRIEVAEACNWITGPAATRFADKRRKRVGCVMQRISVGDASDTMVEQYPDLVHLRLPMEYDPKAVCDLRGRGLAFHDPRTKPGELLPVHDVDESVAADIKRDARLWATEFQQSPIAGSGNVFSDDWWLRWREIDPSAQLVGVIDATMGSKGRRASYLCIAVWALQTVRGQTTARVVDVLRMTAGWTETEAAALFMVRRWPRCRRWLVEEKKFGKALLDLLEKRGVPVINVKPEGQGDKEQRAAAVVPFIREGLCHIPALDAHRPPQVAAARALRPMRDVPPSLKSVHDAIEEGDHHKARHALIRALPPEGDRMARAAWDEFAGFLAGAWGPPGWLDEWREEHKAFPNSGNDDQVDTTTMILSDHSHAFGARLSAVLRGKPSQVERPTPQAGPAIEAPRRTRF